MSYLTSDLPSTILFIAIGVIIGAALSKILNKGPKTAELQQKLEDTQEQFDSYQKEVGTHFQKTAELVNQLTQSYREVHEHLSKGAQELAQNTPDTLTGTDFKALSDQSTSETNAPDKNSQEADSQRETNPQDLSDTDAPNSADSSPDQGDEAKDDKKESR